MSHRGATPKLFSLWYYFSSSSCCLIAIFSLPFSLLHLQKNIVHRDLKLGNMVLNKR